MTDVNRLGGRVSKRTEKAQRTRQRIIEAARGLFVEQGYGATTLQDVAARAGVAVQTIYFVFGNKRTLLKELVDITIAGDDEPIATMDRPWFQGVLAAETAEAQLKAHVKGTRAVLARVAPITTMLAAASASDPEVAQLWPHGNRPRHEVQVAAGKALVDKPGARDGVTAEQAADILYALLGPELYLLLVRDCGWSPQQWERWVYGNLRSQLCAG
jgi:AcrR family transcriptional regulator